jgi:hypothetical protein
MISVEKSENMWLAFFEKLMMNRAIEAILQTKYLCFKQY